MGKKLAKNGTKRDSVRRKSSENWAQTQRKSGRERQSGSNAKKRRKARWRKAKASAKKGRWHDEAAESVYVCVCSSVPVWVCTTFCYPCWLTTPNFPQFPRGCCLCLRHIDFFRLPRAFPTLFSSSSFFRFFLGRVSQETRFSFVAKSWLVLISIYSEGRGMSMNLNDCIYLISWA